MFLWNVLKILEGAIKADLDNRKSGPMAKQVYNFEVFTNKKEQLKKIRRKQKQAQ